MHIVKFIGVGREVESEDGETLLTLAQRKGIHIDSSCGGNGSCHQCRVLVREGIENLSREGQTPRVMYEKDGEPVYLSCQLDVHGDASVEPAPIESLRTDHPTASLMGWTGSEGRALDAPLCVVDPGSYTGGIYEVSATGVFESERGFVATHEVQPTRGKLVRVGDDIDVGDALRRGVSHLHHDDPLVLDFAGRILHGDGIHPAQTSAFQGSTPHVEGAIDFVEWSPLKTRTIITTVGNAAPVGLSLTGLMSCVAALMRAGMCDAELQLSESRFTREIGGQRVAMIVSPDDEAQTPHGVIHKTGSPIVVPQSQLNVIRDGARALGRQLAELEADGPLVVTGDHGTFVPGDLIEALGIWEGETEFVPHASALGAARLAFV